MTIRHYLELDVDDEAVINDLAAISEAERTTLEEALRNVLENFFNRGGHTPGGNPPGGAPARQAATARAF